MRELPARDRLAAVLSPALLDALDDLIAEHVDAAVASALAAASSTAPRWLTLEQAAARLGVSVDAARMRVKRGRLEARHQGRRVYVSAASVDNLAAPKALLDLPAGRRYARPDHENAPAARERPGAGTRR